ncbi:MAG: DUF389 domain-containing protein [Acidobacteriota bacterium]
MTAGDRDAAFEPPASWRNWLARNLRLHSEEKFEIYVSVATSSTLRDATYWIEILLSAGIATLGLTLGSPAVIIGAMLISPLMGPIMSAGLGLAAGDFVLTIRAAYNIFLSSVAAIGFSTLLVFLLPFREMTAEIASRTHPNTLDLFIALFSGAVGALAVCKSLRGVATSIPGAAIAVALMPPLCVAGYGVGVLLTVDRVQGIAVLRGGGLLFLTNLIAITFSSMVVFMMLHIDPPAVRARIREWRHTDPEVARFQRAFDRVLPVDLEKIGSLPARLLLVAGLLVVVFVPLKRSFDAMSLEIHQRQQLNRVQRAATADWEALFGTTRSGAARSYIERLDAAAHDQKVALTIRAFVSESITPLERETYLRSLARELGRRPQEIELSIVEIPTSTYQVARGKKDPEPAAAPPPESIGVQLTRISQEAVTRIEKTRLPPGARALDAAVVLGPGQPDVVVTYLAPTPISEDARALIAAGLAEDLDLRGMKLRLVWIPARITLEFSRRSTTVSSAGAAAIDALAKTIADRTGLRATIESSGEDRITKQRLAAIRAALVAGGIGEERIAEGASANWRQDAIDVTIARLPVAAPSVPAVPASAK